MGIQQGSRARHRQGRGALAGDAGGRGGPRGQAAARAAWPDGRRCEDRPAEWAGPAEEEEGGMWPWPSGWVASSLPEGGEGGEGD